MLAVSAKEDILAFMENNHHPELLAKIETFLSETGIGASYFGKKAVGNSEVVTRLRSGKRVWPETEAQLINFISDYAAPQTQGAQP